MRTSATSGSAKWDRSGQPVTLLAFAVGAFALSCWPAATGAQGGDALKITVGKPFTIAKTEKHLTWGFWNFPYMRKCADGSLLLCFSTREDAFLSIERAPSLYRSRDGGKTWKPDPMGKLKHLSPGVRAAYTRYNKGKEPVCGMGLSAFCNLSDGSSITYYYHAMRGDAPPRYVNSMWHSPDGGKTWHGPVDSPITVPGNALDRLGRGPAIWARAVQLPNGDLVTTAHSRFKGDKKLLVIALGSSDKGRNWHYLGTVARDETIDTEGFTEPIVCNTADGALICFMRTQGGHPMYQSWSRDGGKTWSKPQKSGVLGVAPDMHLLSNGVLACSYGRPRANIMFSADGTGRKWTNHMTIFPGHGTYYTTFEEIAPGRLLYVFDAINFKDAPDAKPANCIRGVYIDVRRAE